MNTSSASPADPRLRSAGNLVPSRRTVDAPTRAFHWLFAFSFLGAWLTGDGERWRLVHVTLGYTMMGLLAWRGVWGLWGPRPARWTTWFARLRGLPAWVRGLRAPRRNLAAARPLLGALAVLALLGLTLITTASGFVLYDESFGGILEDAMEALHEGAGNAMLAVVLLHVALVVGTSLFTSQHAVRAMLTGRAPGRGPDLVAHNRPLLAAALLAAVLGFWGWQWRAAPAGPTDDRRAVAEQDHRSSHHRDGRTRRHDDD